MTDSKSDARQHDKLLEDVSTPERLQKVLARAGLGSRRQIEDWIRAGRITVDGAIATLGVKVGRSAEITVDGRKVTLDTSPAAQMILYHKPVGELCTRRDPAGRRTVFDALSEFDASRLISVGRLDINTSGLLLLTTDGDTAHRLMHPSGGLERVYRCRVDGVLGANDLEKLSSGIELHDGLARFDSITLDPTLPARRRKAGGRNRWYRVTLMRGRNREVRRLFAAAGVEVNRLIRVRYGNVELPIDLAPGQWRELSDRAVRALLDALASADDDSGDGRPSG